MKGGKVFEIIFIILAIILVGVLVILFIDKNFDFISVFVMLATMRKHDMVYIQILQAGVYRCPIFR